MERNSVLVNSWADSVHSVNKRPSWLNLQLFREQEKTLPTWFNDPEWKQITITLDWNISVPTRPVYGVKAKVIKWLFINTTAEIL